MKKLLALLIIVSVLFVSCVSQPRFGDYVGYDKIDALNDLQKMKTSNTVKLVLNWLLWGWVGLFIPSIVDTVNYINYADDFDSIERRINATPNGAKVGE